MTRSRTVPNFELPDPAVLEILASKTPTERLAQAFEANRFARERLRAHLAYQHPEWNGAELQAEIARRMLWNNPLS